MNRLKANEIVRLFNECNNGSMVAGTVSDFVNSYSFDSAGFVKEMIAQPKKTQILFTNTCFVWIDKLSRLLKEDRYDERNKYSVETADKIKKLLGEKLEKITAKYKGYNLSGYCDEKLPFELMFTESMSREHKTLQQSFSSIVFRWLIVLKDLELNEEFTECSSIIGSEFDRKYYNTPLI